MSIITGQTDGPLDISGHLTVAGQINHEAVVRAGGELVVNGQTNAKVTVHAGGTFRSNGQASTLIIEGVAILRGMIGVLVIRGDGKAFISEGSFWQVSGKMKMLNARGVWVPAPSNSSISHPSWWEMAADGSMTEAPSQGGGNVNINFNNGGLG